MEPVAVQPVLLVRGVFAGAVRADADGCVCSAHIGTELRLKRAPAASGVSGETHITPGSHVRIESALMTNVSLLKSDGESVRAQAMMRRVQAWPLLGRLVSHGTASYWMALNEVKTGSCEWDEW